MKISAEIIHVFSLEQEKVEFYMDKKSNLYWSTTKERLKPITTMPWEYQLPFFLRFLHNNELAERFKNMEILGAIDVFIKHVHFFENQKKQPSLAQ